jgi:rubredoxin
VKVYFCEVCGFNFGYEIEPYLLEYTDGGSGFDGEYTIHWFNAIVKCPGCGHIFEYQASS